ncbi:amidohydrolase family protein [Amycolatopsis sp. TRM77291]
MNPIDTDVHVAPRDISEIRERLSDYWRQYVDEGSVRLRPEHRAERPAPDDGESPPRVPATLGELSTHWTGGAVAAALLSCTVLFDLSRNPDFETACARAVNDWQRDRFLDRDHRLLGGIVLPLLDVDAAVAELTRVAEDDRFVQVILPVRIENRWGDRRYHRLFDVAAEAGLVVCFHAGGRTGLSAAGTGYTAGYVEQLLGDQHLATQNQLVSLLAGGVFARTPTLRVTMAECGFSWLHPLLWRLDKDWKSLWREVPWLDRPPSDVVTERIRFTLEPGHLPPGDEEIREVADLAAVSNHVMYSSDFPHVPGSRSRRMLDLLADGDRGRVLRENALEHYPRLARR